MMMCNMCRGLIVFVCTTFGYGANPDSGEGRVERQVGVLQASDSFFPLAEANRWVYKFELPTTQRGSLRSEETTGKIAFVREVVEKRKLGDRWFHLLTSTYPWKSVKGLLPETTFYRIKGDSLLHILLEDFLRRLQ